MTSVKTVHLSRTFKAKKKDGGGIVQALRDVSIEINRGEIFGVLGPNGAGKSTLIKIFSTLLLPTEGKAYVAGYDVSRDYRKVQEKINMVSGGETSGYGLLTVRENLWMFSQMYNIPSKTAKENIDRLLKEFGLYEKRNERVRTLSTGMRQKMNMIRGFMTDPEIIFLDEPTLGLDVGASRIIRNFITEWIREHPKRTVLLTTHYMAEAEELCDRIAIIDNGRVIALETPENLKKLVTTEFPFTMMATGVGHPERVRKLVGNATWKENDEGALKFSMILKDESVIADLVSMIVEEKGKIIHITKREPTLEDVFIKLVGRGLD